MGENVKIDVVCTGFIWFVTVERWAVVNMLMNFFGSTQVEKFIDWLRAAIIFSKELPRGVA